MVKVEKSEINPLATATLQTIPSSDGETLASILKEAEQTDPTTVFHPAGLNVEPVLLAKPVATPLVSKKGELSGESLVEIEVQSPADLLQIASASGLSYQTVKSLNPEILRWCTPPSSGKYRIKLPMLAKDRFLETYNHTSYPRKVQFLSYLTRSGDSLTRVAQKFGIRVDPMADLNGISPRMVLRKGTRIFLPIPSDRTRTLATLEVLEPVSHRRGRKRRRSVRISQRHRHAAHSRGMLSDS